MAVSNADAPPIPAAQTPAPAIPAVSEPAVTHLVRVPLLMHKYLVVGGTATSSESEGAALRPPAFMVPHNGPSVDVSEDLPPENTLDPTSKVSSSLFI